MDTSREDIKLKFCQGMCRALFAKIGQFNLMLQDCLALRGAIVKDDTYTQLFDTLTTQYQRISTTKTTDLTFQDINRFKSSIEKFIQHIHILGGLYNIYIMPVDNLPILDNCPDPSKIPLIVRYQNEIWIYGLQENGERILTKTTDPTLYQDLPFDYVSTKPWQIVDSPANLQKGQISIIEFVGRLTYSLIGPSGEKIMGVIEVYDELQRYMGDNAFFKVATDLRHGKYQAALPSILEIIANRGQLPSMMVVPHQINQDILQLKAHCHPLHPLPPLDSQYEKFTSEIMTKHEITDHPTLVFMDNLLLRLRKNIELTDEAIKKRGLLKGSDEAVVLYQSNMQLMIAPPPQSSGFSSWFNKKSSPLETAQKTFLNKANSKEKRAEAALKLSTDLVKDAHALIHKNPAQENKEKTDLSDVTALDEKVVTSDELAVSGVQSSSKQVILSEEKRLITPEEEKVVEYEAQNRMIQAGVYLEMHCSLLDRGSSLETQDIIDRKMIDVTGNYWTINYYNKDLPVAIYENIASITQNFSVDDLLKMRNTSIDLSILNAHFKNRCRLTQEQYQTLASHYPHYTASMLAAELFHNIYQNAKIDYLRYSSEPPAVLAELIRLVQFKYFGGGSGLSREVANRTIAAYKAALDQLKALPADLDRENKAIDQKILEEVDWFSWATYNKNQFYSKTKSYTENQSRILEYEAKYSESPFTTFEYKTQKVVDALTTADIKRQFRKLAIKYHPDKCPDKSDKVQKAWSDRFVKLKEASELLLDPKLLAAAKKSFHQFAVEEGNEIKADEAVRYEHECVTLYRTILTGQVDEVVKQLIKLQKERQTEGTSELLQNKIDILITALAAFYQQVNALNSLPPKSDDFEKLEAKINALKAESYFILNDRNKLEGTIDSLPPALTQRDLFIETKPTGLSDDALTEYKNTKKQALLAENNHFVAQVFNDKNIAILKQNRSWVSIITKGILAAATLSLAYWISKAFKHSGLFGTQSEEMVHTIKASAQKQFTKK